ncbi:DUF2399 domain-containing protein [Streptomyces albipurpureus]|uniref:DUF2399 domain-containing protein n=1 Tax=Streptomyces albipurpureus TaxID=2897419 RepID=A0ABT0UWC1_9ACTN|nr:DUF2399 domain-containing protein [Streptomyces sp. CWNU-1]MCM2392526.1 DUF2399 domain-containing protein [Streptomyces sp. CWNU-1]
MAGASPARSAPVPASTQRPAGHPAHPEYLRRFGPHCPPLVCTSGWPNSAVIQLLRALAEQGATLRYHGDFDGEGIRIAAYVMDKTPAVPWRMAAGDYLAALAHTPHGPPLGRITKAPWDPVLTSSMAERGMAVVEETVADSLLDDLVVAAGDLADAAV